MSTKSVNKQLYQWIAGDKAGTIVTASHIEYDEDDQINYIVFENGDRVNAQLEGQMFVKIDSADDGFIIKQEVISDIRYEKGQDGVIYEVPGPDHGKIKFIKIPKKSINTSSEDKKDKIVDQSQQISLESQSQKINDPVFDLLQRAKKQKYRYQIDLCIEGITKELFNVIKDNYEDGEDKALDYIVSLIDIPKIKVELKEKLKKVYNENQDSISD